MSSVVPNVVPDRSQSFGWDLAGIFSFLFDPQGAAARLPRTWFWVVPLLLSCIAYSVYSAVSTPLMLHYMQTAPIPNGMSPDQYANMLSMQQKFSWIGMIVAPIIVVVISVISAALMLAVASMLAIPVKFVNLFNLLAGCGIIGVLQVIAWIVILKAKGEISSQAELRPPLGIDIFLPEGTSKVLLGIAGYFSIFGIWMIVMMILVFSAGFRVGKGKAAAVISPVVFLGLMLAIVGSLFQK